MWDISNIKKRYFYVFVCMRTKNNCGEIRFETACRKYDLKKKKKKKKKTV